MGKMLSSAITEREQGYWYLTNAAGSANNQNELGGRLGGTRPAGLTGLFRPRRLLLHGLRLCRRREPPCATTSCRAARDKPEGDSGRRVRLRSQRRSDAPTRRRRNERREHGVEATRRHRGAKSNEG
jgi:hypothetical protein